MRRIFFRLVFVLAVIIILGPGFTLPSAADPFEVFSVPLSNTIFSGRFSLPDVSLPKKVRGEPATRPTSVGFAVKEGQMLYVQDNDKYRHSFIFLAASNKEVKSICGSMPGVRFYDIDVLPNGGSKPKSGAPPKSSNLVCGKRISNGPTNKPYYVFDVPTSSGSFFFTLSKITEQKFPEFKPPANLDPDQLKDIYGLESPDLCCATCTDGLKICGGQVDASICGGCLAVMNRDI